ncbi:hypothetical protein D9M72_392210 [compost metagenome]
MLQHALEVVGALHAILAENGAGVGEGRREPAHRGEFGSDLQFSKARQVAVQQCGAVGALVTHATVTVATTGLGHGIEEQIGGAIAGAMGDHADTPAVHVHHHVGDVFGSQVEVAAPTGLARPGAGQVGGTGFVGAVEVELHRVGVKAGAAVVVPLAGQQLPAALHREDVVLPADGGFHPHRKFADLVNGFQRVQTVLADMHVLGAHHAVATLEPHPLAVGALERMLRGRRHDCVDQRIGTVHQDAGGLAGDAVTLDVAVARVQRIRIDASQFQRAGVDHHAAPGAVEDGHRTIRQDAVQPVSVRHQSGLLEGVAHEVLAVDPAIAGVGGGIVEDGLPDLLRRRVLHAHFQVARVARSQLQVRVRVHVVQARHGEAPFQVQHAGTRTDQAVHFPTGTDCNEAPSANGHGFGPGVGGIHGVDTAVSQHEVGGAGRPRQVR